MAALKCGYGAEIGMLQISWTERKTNERIGLRAMAKIDTPEMMRNQRSLVANQTSQYSQTNIISALSL